MCPRGNHKLSIGCRNIVSKGEDKKNIDPSYPKKSAKQSSGLSTTSSMSRTSLGDFVYKRRKLHANSNSGAAINGIDDSPRIGFSTVTCNAAMAEPNAAKERHLALPVERETKTIKERWISSTPKESLSSKSLVDETPITSAIRSFEVDNATDSCSSSKSNIDQVTSFNKDEYDEFSGCSSNVATVKYMEDVSEKEICIHILRRHGLLSRDCTTRSIELDENTISNCNTCFRSCKICSISESTSKLLICDNCEANFHLKCHKPRVKIVPTGEWFCQTCVRKGCRVARKFSTVKSELSGNECVSPKGKMNALGLMLRKNEPYTTSVRIGKAFQAEVPDWHGSRANDDGIAEPTKLEPSEYLTFHEFKPCKTSKSGTLNNWLQCQAILDTSENDLRNKTICGKWRRAPLFEVQTDEWECFSSISWEPRFADCAVPQEISTKEVHRQLKCVEKLRLQLHDQKKT